MEVKKMNGTTKSSSNDHDPRDRDQKEKEEEEEEEEEVILPGFRFHPTDEELVGFYLRRKIEKKPISIEIIKQADIYKYDPWDLPRVSTVGDKEWYFFCIRGRKYRNSIRPNRVTGSGFWKATGIDKPIHSLREPHACIGLKKSLVYYRGSAGKGTKTDWMMHEFRLPPTVKITNFSSPKDIAQEAEVWTLCRIFKRTPSYKKYTPNWKDSGVAAAANNGTKLNYKPVTDSSSKTCSSSVESETSCEQKQQYNYQQNETKPFIVSNQFEMINQRNQNDLLMSTTTTTTSHHHHHHQNQSQSPIVSASYSSSSPSLWSPNAGDHDFFRNGNWDELRSVVELAIDPTSHVYID